ncbi:MAG: amino acid adenylation domain-containing protein [Rhodanobacteraceae bacterium]
MKTERPPRRDIADAAASPVSDPTLHACVERQARLAPDSVAVKCGAESLTYRELNGRANRLAHRLRSLGAGPDSLVGIGLERSPAMVVGLLAILKAGAAYLPLDLAYPRDRLEFMLADADVGIVLTSGNSLDSLPSHGGKTLLLDDEQAISAQPDSDPAPLSGADDLAYVIYTSGSTGKPKGCLVTHANVVRLFAQTQVWFGFGPEDVWTFFHSHAFDFSVWEIWGALVHGGCVVVVPHEVTRSPVAFHALLVRERVTVLNQTPSAFRALIRADLASDSPRSALSLRYVIFGGEALDLQMLAPWFERHGDERPRLINMYGITETTVHVTYRPLVRADLDKNNGSVIGTPIPDLAVHLLDPDLRPVADGQVGEMFVSGGGVSRGYLNRTELTAERFIDWAAPDGVTRKSYRTGDLARRLPDGDLQYLGRCDQQVKIRGFRIETGEIESVLQRHAGVQSCAVIARDDGQDGARLVAYVVRAANPPAPPLLREHLAANLPEYMLPAAYVFLDSLPLTENGKLDRKALPAPGRERPDLATPFESPVGTDEHRVCEVFAGLLGLDRVGRTDNFFELGGHSLLAARAVAAMNGTGSNLVVTDIFRAPTAAGLAASMARRMEHAIEPSRMEESRRHGDGEPIAIIAMAGRFPGAPDVETFWKNLCEGVESITRFATERLDPSIPAALRNDPAYVPARGVIEGVENFDAAFFGITPREAELMDPQQRIFLELCWECFERGGHVPDAQEHPVSVFAGMYNATYFRNHVQSHPDLIAKLGEFQVMLGNEKDYIATRTAHKLNLTGPAVSVHTACSTSLVAVCQAVEALRRGQCRMALAGGAAVTCPPASGYLHQEGAMLSRDGSTRTFAADASGTVFSDGAAVVLLKRLADAEADNDTIYAVIRGCAVNNDGAGKASFTAPSAPGQAAVIAMALDDAGIDARSISYVEAHGTATPVGDPIEIEGLTTAFRRHTRDTGFCAIGSVKSNVGHLVIAAGAAGLIKTTLALSERKLPPTLHANALNPAIDFANSPFVINDRLREWRGGSTPLRAGVSSFGVGGTNAHVVVEEAPAREPSTPADGPQLLLLSARTPAALDEMRGRLAAELAVRPERNLADVAWTLAVGRKAFAERAFVVAGDCAEATAKLQEDALPAQTAQARDVIWMFPGQGAQYAGMGRVLRATEPEFGDALDACAEILAGELGFDLRERLFSGETDALGETRITQPATFAIEYALAQLWLARGIRPVALIGHSVGEFVAAVIAGVMSLDDAARLVARRGRLMQAQPAGAMLSVRLGADKLVARLPASLSLAAENAPDACVVSGEIADIETLRISLEADGVACRPLRTSHAFHSAMMDAVVEPFRAEVERIRLAAPRIPIASTLQGEWLDEKSATSPDYWTRHLRGTVCFARALSLAAESAPASILLELGPRRTLAALARMNPQARSHVAIASLESDARDERNAWLSAAGRLWCAGASLDASSLDHRERKRRVRLPIYPFERARHWVDAPASMPVVATAPVPARIAASAPIVIPEVRTPTASPVPVQTDGTPRIERLIAQILAMVEDVCGEYPQPADIGTSFVALGLDSLALTQLSMQLSKAFGVRITFRQLMEDLSSPEKLAMSIDRELPPEANAAGSAIPTAAMSTPGAAAQNGLLQQVIAQQMQIMQQQLAMLGAAASGGSGSAVSPAAAASSSPQDDETALSHTRYDVKKAFGAIARIHSGQTELTERQRVRLAAFVGRYVAKTRKSKEYTSEHRANLADPRVVNGFRPLLKEVVYPIVAERSKGSRLWDLDGNEYIDALNGFGMNLFGWQPDFVLDAVRRQLELGYEIGPQHPLAGEVADLVCEMTGFDRAAFCNTGSEAVMGTIRVARTVTGRETLVIFSGSYHGIFDEVIVRGTKSLRSVPAAPGILRNAAQNVLVLEYGTPESLEIIRQRAGEIAAVLVEPVQSRRPDFQPREFLSELRTITRDAGAVLIFDEVVTGFRTHARGAQHALGVDADLASYGKVIGGGFPVGVIAGKREYMDALDGGQWQFGDESIPTVGVTYFAGTFVRHPLALAAAKASLEHLKAQGPALQERLNARTAEMVADLNRFCSEVGAPITVTHFASLWRIGFSEDHSLQDLLFAMMRSRGIHILEHFPCFFTTAHSDADIAAIAKTFRESVAELQEAEFLPRRRAPAAFDASKPPVAGARLGKDPDGRPAWYAPDPAQPGKYVKVEA